MTSPPRRTCSRARRCRLRRPGTAAALAAAGPGRTFASAGSGRGRAATWRGRRFGRGRVVTVGVVWVEVVWVTVDVVVVVGVVGWVLVVLGGGLVAVAWGSG